MRTLLIATAVVLVSAGSTLLVLLARRTETNRPATPLLVTLVFVYFAVIYGLTARALP